MKRVLLVLVLVAPGFIVAGCREQATPQVQAGTAKYGKVGQEELSVRGGVDGKAGQAGSGPNGGKGGAGGVGVGGIGGKGGDGGSSD